MSSKFAGQPDLTQMILQATRKAHTSTDSANYVSQTREGMPVSQEKIVDQAEKFSDGSRTVLQPSLETDRSLPVMDEIDKLIGNQNFKRLCSKINSRAPMIRKNNTFSFFLSTAFLFSVNSGSGYKTSLNLLSDLMVETGLFSEPATRKEYALPSPKEPDASQKIQNILGTLEYALSTPRIITFDITPWLGHTGDKLFKNLLMYLFQNNSKCLIIFRIPYVKQALIDETATDLSDIISTRIVVFEPFTNKELRLIAERMTSPYGISFSADAADQFDRLIEKEKGNGYFYGIHTVRKVIGDIIRELELQESSVQSENNIITSSIIKHAETAPAQEDIQGFEKFSDMIGMASVEQKLREVIFQIQYSRETGLTKRPCMHMFFTGNPGTGKTTVARILGAELKKHNLLRIGKFFEHKGRDLCAEYVGQTTPKTVAICEQAYGSVLFIDEAYSLAAGNSRNDYGKEAIDALIAEMENHYDDLVVIFAGYPEDMEKLLSLNPGMRSRVPYTIEFPNYSRAELFQIFDKMSTEHFMRSPDFLAHAGEFFSNLPSDLLDDKSFGNARFVRNIYERVWGKAIVRSSQADNAIIELTSDDFDNAIKELHLL